METEKSFLKIIYFSLILVAVGSVIFGSAIFIGGTESGTIGQEIKKIKISVPEYAPAALSGRWKLVK